MVPVVLDIRAPVGRQVAAAAVTVARVVTAEKVPITILAAAAVVAVMALMAVRVTTVEEAAVDMVTLERAEMDASSYTMPTMQPMAVEVVVDTVLEAAH